MSQKKDEHQVSRLTTRTQRLLLAAALEEGDARISAWQQWRESVDLDTLDGASFRLIPLLYKNLLRGGVQDIPPRIKGIHRQSWYLNQVLFRNLPELLNQFSLAGIPTLLHKGAALALAYYRDPADRPMWDIDILVPTAMAENAFRMLSENDWKASKGDPYRALRTKHSTPFTRLRGGDLDLHWNLLFDDCSDDHRDNEFWDSAILLETDKFHTKTLSPADHLLQALCHGLNRPKGTAIYWIADAVTLLRHAGPIDWDRLLEQATQRHVGLVVSLGLRYLDQYHTVDIPAEVLDAAQALPVTTLERMENSAVLTFCFGRFVRHWTRHVRRNPHRSMLACCALFPKHLDEACRSSCSKGLFGALLQEIARRWRGDKKPQRAILLRSESTG